MKLYQLVLFTFIFKLQLHYSECDFSMSMFPDPFGINLDNGPHNKPFIDTYENDFEPGSKGVEGYLPQQKQQFANAFHTIKESGAKSNADDIFGSTSWSEDQKTHHVSDIVHENTNNNFLRAVTRRVGILDPASFPERQQPNIFNNINDIFINREREYSLEPEEKVEYKLSRENLIIHMSSMSSPQLIAMHGYPAETHTIVTDDGYILTIHRIPYSKTSKNKRIPKKTVLLHHGIFGNSAHWLIPGPTKALGYILADAGYDVWLANVRGNTYSNAHVSRDVNSFEFWNFTFHEVSQHDLPAVIDYIIDVKGGDVKINYVGHSMGTSVLFALLSTKTQYNKVLRAGFALAPVAYMTNIKSPIKLLAKYSNKIQTLLKLFGGANVIRPDNPALKWLAKHSLELMSLDKEGILEDMMSIFFGHDAAQFNKTLLPLILSHGATSASTKTVVHYAQEIKQSGKFQMFDNGPAGNRKAYGTRFPPQYNLQKITLPIALFSSKNDWLSSVVDAKNLYKRLVNPIEHYIVPLNEFNHCDFLWAIDAPTLVYDRLLQLLEQNY